MPADRSVRHLEAAAPGPRSTRRLGLVAVTAALLTGITAGGATPAANDDPANGAVDDGDHLDESRTDDAVPDDELPDDVLPVDGEVPDDFDVPDDYIDLVIPESMDPAKDPNLAGPAVEVSVFVLVEDEE